MAHISMKLLLEAGVHFGHQTNKWNPKMKPYIFGARNGIYIIDLQQTVVLFHKAYEFVVDMVANGDELLFVGTKKQSQESIREEAGRCSMPYVNQRWLGGMLTNFITIKKSIDRLNTLDKMIEDDSIRAFPKKEILSLQKEKAKLEKILGGIRKIKGRPGGLFIVDPKRESITVKEARKLGIPIVAMVDTNCNPGMVDYVIPSNDDAIRAIKLIVGRIADAAEEGRLMRKDEEIEEELPESRSVISRKIDEDIELGDDELLGEATRAKIPVKEDLESDDSTSEA